MLPTRTSRLRLSLALAVLLVPVAHARGEDAKPPKKILPPVGSVCAPHPTAHRFGSPAVRCIYPDGSEWHCNSAMTACRRNERRVETDHGQENHAADSPMAPTSSTLKPASDLEISDFADTRYCYRVTTISGRVEAAPSETVCGITSAGR